LQEIEDAGLNVIPTVFLEQGATFNANKYFDQFSTNSLIAKPCISCSSSNTFKITANDELTSVVNDLLQQQSMMVQPFMPQINEEGEWSLLFFGGKFSHALVKTPRSKDFRSQPQFGGVVQGKEPAPELLAAAKRYIAEFAKGCLYARVDGLIINGEFYLMELELIDPYLFLSTTTGGQERYYEALSKLLASTFSTLPQN
jgi:glutathione synthase/RimK-type ligase-like ATP-grasp enzyme